MEIEQQVRLQKYLAQCGLCSRRKAELLISGGKITVNGQKITTPGFTIQPTHDSVCFNGLPVKPDHHQYFLLNKPKGYVTTVSDPQGRPVVVSLIKEKFSRIFPVGRLDIDTEGALILTNDGELAQKILHPKYETKKTYLAQIHGHPTKKKIHQLEKGLLIDNKKTAPASTKLRKKYSRSSLIEITVHEGRKHQVKKMFKAIGHPVTGLKRIAYGKLELGNLTVGSYRKITSDELKLLFL